VPPAPACRSSERTKRFLVLVALLLPACGSESPAPADRPSLTDLRPYESLVPAGYAPGTPTPLLILLHGYGSTGRAQDSYFGLSTIVNQEGFLYAYPNGTADLRGELFWNATDACCNFFGSTVDDVAYINAIIDDMSGKYTVDPNRVFVVGHSNGGFMANRLGCDLAGRIAAFVSLAGATWNDPGRCVPARPVNVLLLHGDADTTIFYEGGQNAQRYPGARTTAATWAAKNGCSGGLAPTGQAIDLEARIAGEETEIEATLGCPSSGAVELWTIHGGGHVPDLSATFKTVVWGWLASHPRR